MSWYSVCRLLPPWGGGREGSRAAPSAVRETPHPVPPPPQGVRKDARLLTGCGGRGRKRFRRSKERSRVLTGIVALSLAGSLAGCFTPLYSEAAHPGLVEDMRAIEVVPIPNRVGHYLAEDLIADINGTGQTASPPKYRLVVTISLGTQTPTVNSETNVATSATLTGDATYSLIKVDGGKEVLKGTASEAAAYDRSQQLYADLRAARDAEIRIARALSSEISARIATALAAKPS
jgi:LPS-assembly lipoprotein